MENGPGASARMDLSGRERDRFFASVGGKQFVDLSYLSGADGVGDGRTFARVDFDRDGYEDLVVVNRNAPRLRLFRNAIGPATGSRFLGVHLNGTTNREAVGAKVTVRCGNKTVVRDVASGAGFATQNSSWVTVGLGACSEAPSFEVLFPGGSKQAFKGLESNRWYDVVEGKGGRALNFVRDRKAGGGAAEPGQATVAALRSTGALTRRLVLVETFATWCEACRNTQPALAALGREFGGDLGLVGVTVEPKDDGPAVAKYRADHSTWPLVAYSPALVASIAKLIGEDAPLPSTLLLDVATGRVLLRTAGAPTRSDVARALWSSH